MIEKIKKHPEIYILLIINLIIALIIFQDYGESWDEDSISEYTRVVFEHYANLFNPDYHPRNYQPILRFYGPAVFVSANLSAKLLQAVFPSVSITAFQHLFYFLCFQVGVLSFYSISKKIMTQRAAFAATLLFNTQPLLWGHAFINPKDVPFMSLFTASIAVGLNLVNHFQQKELLIHQPFSQDSLKAMISTDWENSSQKSMKQLKTLLGLSLILALILSVGQPWLKNISADLITNTYTAAPDSALGKLFAALAQNAQTIPVEKYVLKAQTLIENISPLLILLILLITGLIFILTLPTLRASTQHFLRQLFANLKITFKQPILWKAGVVLGITTAIRITGPFAGILITIYGVYILKKKFPAPVIALAVAALFTTYLLWPYLWPAPITNLFESLRTLSGFPWGGRILFAGGQYPADQLPFSYLPTLLTIQFTELVIPLALLGAGVLLTKKPRQPLSFILLGWFLIPLVYMLLLPINLYDNFRQILFIIPPLFIAAGWAIESIFTRISKPAFQYILTAVIIFPGILAIFQLHPYQYIYYNGYVGGVSGAFRQFETDYWNTSYKEAAEFLNLHAPPESKVVVFGSEQIIVHHARADLIIEPNAGGTYALDTGYDFAIVNSRLNKDLEHYPDQPIIFTVERNGAILAVVKELNCTHEKPCKP